MTAGVVGVLAEVIAKHHREFDIYRLMYVCRCGETWPALSDDYDAEIVLHSAHVASVIAALPNIAVVPVVEPTDTKDYSEGGGGEDYLGWEVQDGPYFISVYDQGEVQVSYDGNVGEPVSVEGAHDLGVALLAAARAAGGQG